MNGYSDLTKTLGGQLKQMIADHNVDAMQAWINCGQPVYDRMFLGSNDATTFNAALVSGCEEMALLLLPFSSYASPQCFSDGKNKIYLYPLEYAYRHNIFRVIAAIKALLQKQISQLNHSNSPNLQNITPIKKCI